MASGAAEDLSVFYLNGELANGMTEGTERMTDGTVFSMDGMDLFFVTSYLNKRVWILKDKNYMLLFPNGVPPDRIFTDSVPDLDRITLIILGKRDDKVLWSGYRKGNRFCPQIEDFSENGDVTFFLSNDGISYR